MHNNLVLVTYLLINKEAAHICPLVTRKLNNISVFNIISDGAVALESLLQIFGDLFRIKVGCQPLNNSDTLSTIALLHSQVDLGPVLFLHVDIKVVYMCNSNNNTN